MKKIILLQLFLALTFLSNAQSPKVVSSELNYQYLNPYHYKVDFIFYANCNDSFVHATIPLMIYAASNCTLPQTVLLYKDTNIVNNGGFVTNNCIGSACADSLNSCDGYLKYYFTTTVVLDSACGEYTFQVNTLRPNNISNINLQHQGSIITTLSLINRPINSSVVTLIQTALIVGVNQSVIFLQGAFDNDNDSLVFEIIESFDSSNLSMPPNSPFNIGYSLQNPIGLLSSCSINSANGNINFIANTTGLFIITIKITEYDYITKKKIATKYIDKLICVSPCYSESVDFMNSQSAHISSISGAQFSTDTNSNITADVANPFVFEIKFSPKINSNIKQIKSDCLTTANGSIYKFSISPNNEHLIRFSWTPQFADIGMHTINFAIEDSINCAIYSPIIIPIKILVTQKVLANSIAKNATTTFCYPNPAKNILFYNYPYDIPKSKLIIVNICNQILYQNDADITNHTQPLNISNFCKGVYFVLNRADGSINKFEVE